MSTAPPGWHRQPDGRDRFWDGERWTDEFRNPSETATQQIPLDETRGMPSSESQSGYASQAPGAGSPGGPTGQGSYASPPSYGEQPYAYGQGGGPPSDQPRGGGRMKGCLIALIVVALLAALVVVVGVWLFGSTNDEVAEPTEPTPATLPTELPTALPTELPTALPTGLPTALPTELPTLPGQGESVEAGIGEEFSIGGATIQPGWSLSGATLGFRTVTMSAVPDEESAVPLVFRLTFLQAGSDISSTVCTVPMGTADEPADVACVPLRGDLDRADSVRATGIGG